MSVLFRASLVFLGLGLPQAFAGVGLDYEADASCPDGGRFSDEVSARVGALAFQDSADSKAVIRIVALGKEYMGVMELSGGEKTIRGSSCSEVFDGLVAATAVALDAPTPAPAPVGPVSDKVRVNVHTSQDRVTIAQINGRGVATGSAGSTTVTVESTYYTDLCEAPCSLEFEPGMVELSAYGAGHRAALNKFDLRPGQTLDLQAEPGNGLMAVGGYLLQVVGLGAVTTGALLPVMDLEDLPTGIVPVLLAGGGVGLVGGTGLRFMSRGSFEERSVEVALGGSF